MLSDQEMQMVGNDCNSDRRKPVLMPPENIWKALVFRYMSVRIEKDQCQKMG